MELRSVLRIISHIHLSCGLSISAERWIDERQFEVRESDTSLNTILDEVLVGITTQTFNCFESATNLNIKEFRTSEKIAILVGKTGCGTKISSRVGAFQFSTKRVRFVRRQRDIHIQSVAIVFSRLDTNIRSCNGTESRQTGIGFMHLGFAIELATTDGRRIPHNFGAKEGLSVCIIISNVPNMVAMMRKIK